MARGYQLIQAQTLTDNAGSITFTNIPQNFTDLVIKISARGTQSSASNALTLRFNDATTNYSSKELVGDGGSTSSSTRTTLGSALYIGNITGNSATSSTFSNTEIYIPNYKSTTSKSISVDAVSENNADEAYSTLLAGLWLGSSAITKIDLISLASHGQLMTNSTFYLYGVGGSKASGGTITVDANYTYHTFTSTSNFIPSEKIRLAEVLLVAGGGGGGNMGGAGGGGGGAGGVRLATINELNAGIPYTVLVGSGGTGASGYASAATNGINSAVASFSSSGGGFGGTYTPAGTRGVGAAGGSGGGGGGNDTNTLAGGAGNAGGYTPVEGFKGGDSPVLGQPNGSGGGGAETAGSNSDYWNGGEGGRGTNKYIPWHLATSTGVTVGGSTYIAGGGGGGAYTGAAGGAGGFGGGGTGETRGSGGQTTGTANSGGGGGGGALDAAGGGKNGGSGLVIIRYPNN